MNHLKNHGRRAPISIGIDRRKFWFVLSFSHKYITDSRFPFDIGKRRGGQMLTKNKKISPITDARHALSESGKTQKDHNKHFDHDKIYHRFLILDAFLALRLFQGSRSESALIDLFLIADPRQFFGIDKLRFVLNE
jgi:hypothetical protein